MCSTRTRTYIHTYTNTPAQFGHFESSITFLATVIAAFVVNNGRAHYLHGGQTETAPCAPVCARTRTYTHLPPFHAIAVLLVVSYIIISLGFALRAPASGDERAYLGL